MSNTLRIALVAEGLTDYVFLESALNAILSDRSFQLKQLHPECSEAFDKYGQCGTGWGGIYKWCRQSVTRNGCISNDFLFKNYNLLIIHLDADVAGMRYKDANINNASNNLPCMQKCPPASATTNILRIVILSWMNENKLPNNIVFCTPSKNMEAWVMKALFPNDRIMRCVDWECFANPGSRLSQQPIKSRIKKSVSDYNKKRDIFQNKWNDIVRDLSEAKRFDNEFRSSVAGLNN